MERKRAKAILPSDRVFLGKQGQDPKGVIASGYAISPYFEDTHWEDETKTTTYNLIEFDTILTPDTVMPRTRLIDGPLAAVEWRSQRGGITIPDAAAIELERRWSEYVDEIGFGRPDARMKRFPGFRPYQPDPRKRKAVEEAAVQETMRYFRELGYTIRDRQRENVGWDIEVVKDSEVLFIEVKGVSESDLAIELTPNEYSHMQRHTDRYVLSVLTDALRDTRSLSLFRCSGGPAEWRDANGRRLLIMELTGARIGLA